MGKPRVAFMMQPFDKVLAENKNSVGIITSQLASRLVRDFDITIYKRNISYRIDDFYKDGIHYRAIPLNYDNQIRRFKKNPNEYKVFTRRYYPFYVLQTALDLRKHPVDIIQLFNFAQNAEMIHFLNPDVKIVLRMGCEWLSQSPDKANKFVDKIDHIIGCSRYLTDHIKEANSVLPEQVSPLHNGVDIETFKPLNDKKYFQGDRPPNLLYVGRTSPEKGIHVMLEALKLIKRNYPDVKLTLIGGMHGQLPYKSLLDIADEAILEDLKKFYVKNIPDEYDEYIYDLIEEYDLKNNVIIAGEKFHVDTIKYYQRADLFLFPTVCNEGFGIPVIEAMATGIPVVASRTGGVPELIEDGKTGLLVERNNAQALSDAIIELLKNPEKLKMMGKNSRRRVVHHFDWDVIAEELKQTYFRLLSDG